MSGREWNPGDVAMQGSSIALRTKEGWAYSDGSVGGLHQDTYRSVRPLVVIDPKDREQVRRLRDALEPGMGLALVEQALGSLTADPEPDEPTGLGAVVEASWRTSRVACNGACQMLRIQYRSKKGMTHYWLCQHCYCAGQYADLAAVRVLSEGVTS